MSATRVYKLAPTPESLAQGAHLQPLLIEASGAAQAYRHVARRSWHASVATQVDLIDLIRRGIPVEKASDE